MARSSRKMPIDGERLAQLLVGGGDAQLEGASPAGLHIQPESRPTGGGLGVGGGGPRRGRLLGTQPPARAYQRGRGQPAGPNQEGAPTRRPGARRWVGCLPGLGPGLLVAVRCWLPILTHGSAPHQTPALSSHLLFAAAGRLDRPESEGGRE